MAEIDNLLDNVDIHRVSDIHIKSGLRPMARIDGDLINICKEIISHEMVEEYIKSMIPDKFKKFLEDGEIDFRYKSRGNSNFRVNAFKCRGTYAICMRVIKNIIPKLSDINNSIVLREFTELKDGLVLVTGPTGSGKSTTLAAMINEINTKQKKHIITLEDPIEYIHETKKSMINQREIGEDTKSYTVGLRSALREDPDVILVGEMRDRETIEVALRAAQTGHLVFSTLHNLGAVNSIYRIINSFDSAYQNEVKIQISSVLRGVVSQVLIPNLSGKGRTAAMEIMVCTPSVKSLIREGNYEQIDSFIQMGNKFGMQTIDMDLRRLVNDNIISREEYEKLVRNKK